jgi:hypothetical protein
MIENFAELKRALSGSDLAHDLNGGTEHEAGAES